MSDATAHRTRTIKPIVILDAEKFGAIVDLVDEFNSHGTQRGDGRIGVTYRNGDKIDFPDVGSFFEAQNRKSNPIVRVTVGGSLFVIDAVRLELVNKSYSAYGAEIQLRGAPEETEIMAERLVPLLEDETRVNHILPAASPIYLAALSTAFLNLIVFKGELLKLFSQEFYSSGSIFGYTIFFVLLPCFILAIIFSEIQVRFLGRFVLYWGDSKTRFDKACSIFNYSMFSLPVIFLSRLFLSSN